MQKLLDRYIFTELIAPFFISLAALCFVLLTTQMLRLVELVITKGVGFLTIVQVFLQLLPSFLVLTLPIAGIIASVTAFSRLSFDKELVAMRAAGLSLLRLARPVLVFSCLLCVLTLVLSRWGQPWHIASLKGIALSLLRDQLTVTIDKGVFNEPTPRMVVYVADSQDPSVPSGIFISDERQGEEARIIVASAYQFLNDPETHQVGLRLINGTIHAEPRDPAQYHKVAFSNYELKLDLSQSGLGAPAGPQTRAQVIDELNRTQWKDPGALRRLMEHDKDLAFPVAALIFGMMGVPVGIVSKRSGRIGGFAVGIAIVVIYYVINVVFEFQVTSAKIPPMVGAWMPNALFLGATVLLYWRVGAR